MSIVAEAQPSRQGYRSAVTLVAPGALPARAGEVNPSWFHFVQLLGLRPATGAWGPEGAWLNCAFEYRKPGGQSAPYALEAAVQFDAFARRTGRSFVRCCSCPDARKRAETGARGEARKCKHMVALAAQLAGACGQHPPVTGIPAAVFLPRHSKPARDSQAVAQYKAWLSGEWEPADGPFRRRSAE